MAIGQGIKTAAHQNNTVRARIIALYDIFLIELEIKVRQVTEMIVRVGSRTFVGILTFPFGVMTDRLADLRRSEVSECLARLRLRHGLVGDVLKPDPDHFDR